MDYNNKIDACITTINTELNNIDIETITKENERLMKIIQNTEFEGVEQQLVDKVNAAN